MITYYSEPRNICTLLPLGALLCLSSLLQRLPSPQSALNLHLEPWTHAAGLGFYSIWAIPLPPHSHSLLQEQFFQNVPIS